MLAKIFLPLVLLSANSWADEPQDLTPILAPILEESKLPALAAAAISRDGLRAHGAVGLRKRGEKKPVTLEDKFHLGSCTKPMTATLAAILIEEGVLKWDTTIAEVLDKKIRKRDSAYDDVTVEQLLAHVGGLSKVPPAAAWEQAWKDQGKKKPATQRIDFLKAVLSEAPSYPPGTKTEYSNQGYTVVGVMLEILTKKSWETLMQERLFKPLGMTSAGFRAPSSPRRLDHPWGHRADGTPDNGDNPDAIGPGATVHATIGDWAKFAQFHLQRKPGTVLKSAASFDKLNALLPSSGKHSVGGWLVHDLDHMGGHCMQMIGSNTMWLATLWILPERDLAVVVSTNSGEKDATATCDNVAGKLIAEFAKKN